MLRHLLLALVLSSNALTAFGQPVCCVVAPDCCRETTPVRDDDGEILDAPRCGCCTPPGAPIEGSSVRAKHDSCHCEHILVDALRDHSLSMALSTPPDSTVEPAPNPESFQTNGTNPVRRIFAERMLPLRI